MMKRFTLAEIRARLDEEIEKVAKLKDLAFGDEEWGQWDLLHARLHGLFFSRQLIHGNKASLKCYETGRNNSGGATYVDLDGTQRHLKLLEE